MAWYRMSGGTDTSDATATASNILSGKTAYVNDNKITGTMEDNSGITKDASSVSQDSDYAYLTVPSNGYYDTSSKLRTLLSNISANPSFKGENLSISTSGTTITGIIPANKRGILIMSALGNGLNFSPPTTGLKATCTLTNYKSNMTGSEMKVMLYMIDSFSTTRDISINAPFSRNDERNASMTFFSY